MFEFFFKSRLPDTLKVEKCILAKNHFLEEWLGCLGFFAYYISSFNICEWIPLIYWYLKLSTKTSYNVYFFWFESVIMKKFISELVGLGVCVNALLFKAIKPIAKMMRGLTVVRFNQWKQRPAWISDFAQHWSLLQRFLQIARTALFASKKIKMMWKNEWKNQ